MASTSEQLQQQLATLLRDKAEFNSSMQNCQQQIQQAQGQIAAANERFQQLRGAVAYIDLVEQRLRKEIEAAVAIVPPAPPPPRMSEPVLYTEGNLSPATSP